MTSGGTPQILQMVIPRNELAEVNKVRVVKMLSEGREDSDANLILGNGVVSISCISFFFVCVNVRECTTTCHVFRQKLVMEMDDEICTRVRKCATKCYVFRHILHFSVYSLFIY